MSVRMPAPFYFIVMTVDTIPAQGDPRNPAPMTVICLTYLIVSHQQYIYLPYSPVARYAVCWNGNWLVAQPLRPPAPVLFKITYSRVVFHGPFVRNYLLKIAFIHKLILIWQAEPNVETNSALTITIQQKLNRTKSNFTANSKRCAAEDNEPERIRKLLKKPKTIGLNTNRHKRIRQSEISQKTKVKQKTNICRSNLRGHQSFQRTKKYHTGMDSGNNYSFYSSKSAVCVCERERYLWEWERR
jgi:hypothetical protein